MYAMTGKLIAQDGKQNELAAILLEAAKLVGSFAGCRFYLVHTDLNQENHLWVYEIWDDKKAHDDALGDEKVRALISQARPLLAAAPDGAELNFLGGHGIDS